MSNRGSIFVECFITTTILRTATLSLAAATLRSPLGLRGCLFAGTVYHTVSVLSLTAMLRMGFDIRLPSVLFYNTIFLTPAMSWAILGAAGFPLPFKHAALLGGIGVSLQLLFSSILTTAGTIPLPDEEQTAKRLSTYLALRSVMA